MDITLSTPPTRFTPLDGPGAKKLGGPPHAQKNLQHSVPPHPNKRWAKKGGPHTQSSEVLHLFIFTGGIYAKKSGKAMYTVK